MLENLGFSQISKNYFRKGLKFKGNNKISEALKNIKERYLFKKIKKRKFALLVKTKRTYFAKKNHFYASKKNNSFKSNLKKTNFVKFKKKIFVFRKLKILKLTGFRQKNLKFLYRKNNRGSLEKIIFKKKKLFKAQNTSNWVFLKCLDNCRWRVSLRSRWVSGKRLKIPFFVSKTRDIRHVCKTFVKSIFEVNKSNFVFTFLKELFLSLTFKSFAVLKRTLAYKTLYASSLYTSGSTIKKNRRRKKINRY